MNIYSLLRTIAGTNNVCIWRVLVLKYY